MKSNERLIVLEGYSDSQTLAESSEYSRQRDGPSDREKHERAKRNLDFLATVTTLFPS
jgi:hypothetical protein